LSAIVTTTFFIDINQISKSNAIEIGLEVVETEGYTFVICSDKTRTSSMNQMAAQAFQLFKRAK
jgi:magnesium-transporting ATPase (P-type)